MAGPVAVSSLASSSLFVRAFASRNGSTGLNRPETFSVPFHENTVAPAKMRGHDARTGVRSALNDAATGSRGFRAILAIDAVPVRSKDLHRVMEDVAGEHDGVGPIRDLEQHMARCVPRCRV